MKKKKISKVESSTNIQQSKEEFSILKKGSRNIKDILAPNAFDFSNEDFVRVGNKFCRSFIMNGYPNEVYVKWLDCLYNYKGDIDTAIYIIPTNERDSIDELTTQITQLITQLEMERQKGSIKHLSRLQDQIDDLMSQRTKLERSYEKLFHVQICSNLYTDSEEQLKKESETLDKELRGKNINHMPLYLRQKDAFRTGLPFGNSFVPEFYRSLNTGALTACFPFYNSELCHKSGVFQGINVFTKTPIYIDYYNRDILNNGNIVCIGTSGAGKTFAITLLTMRSMLKGIRTAIIDPEGEYVFITRYLGGTHITIAPESRTKLNPFDIEAEQEEFDIKDDNGEVITVRKESVKINEKVADILNLLLIIFESSNLDTSRQGVFSGLLQKLYKDKGFTEDPESLFEESADGGEFNPETGMFHTEIKKKMPTLTDFYNLVETFVKDNNDQSLIPYLQCLSMFKSDGIYGMFDCQTSEDVQNYSQSPVVTFDVSKIEDKVLRPIGMYVALSWTWEKFGKKNIDVKKRVICDEAWMLLDKNMPGADQSGFFLNTLARRFRKRNGGLMVASQSLLEFHENQYGQSILNNSATRIFMKQDANTIGQIKDSFRLSEGESNFLVAAQKGQMLIKMEKESTIGFALAFDFEKQLIEDAKLRLGKM